MAKVTVAIPTYNREAYLKDCIQSILQQSFQDFEVIVFDNHSDFDTKRLVQSFNDSRIKLLINSENIGGIANLDQAFCYKYATPYVIVFHDDDVMHPDLLLKEVALLDNNENIVFVVTDLHEAKIDGSVFEFPEVKNNKSTLIFSDYTDLVRLLLKHFGFCFDSIMYRTFALNGIVEYSKRFNKWCDRPFFIDIAKKGMVAVIREGLVNYRVHNGQDSMAEHSAEFNYFINVYNYYKACLPQPLTKADKRLFHRWSTNNLILLIASFSSGASTYFKLLKQCYEMDLFKPSYINIRGVYYIILVVKKWIRMFFK
ncbi:MAG: glycosyltransferase family 2 protein [Candidatus Falkowbacteria bacterium]